jgi:hypothetical protein
MIKLNAFKAGLLGMDKLPEIKAPPPNMKEGSRTCRDSQTFMAVLDDILGRNSRLSPMDGTTRLLLDGGTLKPKDQAR